MPDLSQTTDAAVLSELGRRIEANRLERNLTQVEFGELAGVSRSTVQKLERGGSVQTLSLVKVLRALGLLDEVGAAIPESVVLPVMELDRERGRRRRARHSRGGDGADDSGAAGKAEEPWRWGEEG